MYDKVCQKRRRCAPPFLSYSQKTSWGCSNPPPRGRGIWLNSNSPGRPSRMNCLILIVVHFMIYYFCYRYVSLRRQTSAIVTGVLLCLQFDVPVLCFVKAVKSGYIDVRQVSVPSDMDHIIGVSVSVYSRTACWLPCSCTK